VNTDADEVDVRMSKDGKKLYFASNRPGGLGGYDVYYSEKDENGAWQKPVAFAKPINSAGTIDAFLIAIRHFF